METALSVIALFALVGVLSTVGGRWMTRKQGAMWVWDHSSVIGWILIGVGAAAVIFGLARVDQGIGMSSILGLGSLFLIAGLWMIW